MSLNIDQIKIPEDKDLRKKVSAEIVRKIKLLYEKGNTQKSIAEEFGISQSAVCYIVSTKARENLRIYRQENPPKRRTKEESKLYMRNLRKRKREILDAARVELQCKMKMEE